MSAVAIIPARGGSTRIPRKNIRPFHGKPIIAHSIQTAIDTHLFDRIIVSTDDLEISEAAQNHGADVLVRPKELAENDVGTQEVMAHAIRTVHGYQYACCIYATAPMMLPEDLIKGWHMVHRPGLLYALSVGAEPLQDAGQWYWGLAWAFKDRSPLLEMHTGFVPIPMERVCDINTEEDWTRAEKMYEELQRCRA